MQQLFVYPRRQLGWIDLVCIDLLAIAIVNWDGNHGSPAMS